MKMFDHNTSSLELKEIEDGICLRFRLQDAIDACILAGNAEIAKSHEMAERE